MQKFSFTKCGSSRYFYQVLWQFLKIAAKPLNFWGASRRHLRRRNACGLF